MQPYCYDKTKRNNDDVFTVWFISVVGWISNLRMKANTAEVICLNELAVKSRKMARILLNEIQEWMSNQLQIENEWLAQAI